MFTRTVIWTCRNRVQQAVSWHTRSNRDGPKDELSTTVHAEKTESRPRCERRAAHLAARKIEDASEPVLVRMVLHSDTEKQCQGEHSRENRSATQPDNQSASERC